MSDAGRDGRRDLTNSPSGDTRAPSMTSSSLKSMCLVAAGATGADSAVDDLCAKAGVTLAARTRAIAVRFMGDLRVFHLYARASRKIRTGSPSRVWVIRFQPQHGDRSRMQTTET